MFFKMTYQKVVKSQNQVSSLLNVYRNFGWHQNSGMLWYLLDVYHTQFSIA